ncbi:metallophosphoesterase 1 isoform X2 [Coregonus clupeaformis]|uniref:metallophosphoesterase 1 isoform X2 n=1 Tax=Coregonus clupeaformis TaxID=59861 RepID=UPI001BE0F5D4|nr:metallophosphoesterase 1 isoform X2 [Coregonus clupeaformis]
MSGLSVACSAVIVLFGAVCSVFIFCEYLIYYAAILQCGWPGIDHGAPASEKSADGEPEPAVLRAMVLSDTHLLGAVGGHWFDKLRREWQMERAFQTALALLQPENWEDDVCRFQKMFRHPSDTELVVLVGNHDIGFHYEMDWFKLQRFEKAFNTTSTRMVTKKGVNFLLVNSVALHGDGCPICQSVEKQLYTISRDLNCSLLQNSESSVIKEYCQDAWTYPSTPPIILQHYPLYRVSDAGCTGRDAAPTEERHLLFREKYDVLSREASHRLLQWFKPRLVLSGHTHSGCQVLHDNQYPEISVPSFNWRNRNNPSFILGSFSPGGYGLSKCFLPEESTVIALYCSTGASLLLLPLVHCLWMRGLLRCLSLCPISKHKSL